MLVMKFGGTSVQNADSIRKAAEIIRSKEDNCLVVVSAAAGVTNSLTRIIAELQEKKVDQALFIAGQVIEKYSIIGLELGIDEEIRDFLSERFGELNQLIGALDLLGEISPKSMDSILSLGEIISSRIIYSYLLKAGLPVEYIDARQLIRTDSNYTEAEADMEKTAADATRHCRAAFRKHKYILTGGFMGSNPQGHTTTLGRGGSDYSAALLASALGADKLEIWTDVDGILTSDPRTVSGSLLIKNLSYSEASELAYFGAKVLHPKTIFPAVEKNIPVYVLNTFRPQLGGTKIMSGKTNKHMIKAIAFRKGTTIINIHSNRMLGAYGFLSRVFEVFKHYQTPVDLVTTSEVSISLTIDKDENLEKIIDDLEKYGTIEIVRDSAIIAAIGEGIRDTAGIAARFFGVLRGINITMVSIGASEVNLSITVSENDLVQAVSLLHNEFFKEDFDTEVFERVS